MNKFTNFTLYVSIDAIKERAELYRNGTVWETIEANLRILVDSGVKFTVITTVGATNIHHIPEVHQYLYNNNLLYQDRMVFNKLTAPAYLNCRLLPNDLKKEITDKFNNYILTMPNKTHFNERLKVLVDFMNSEDQSNLIPEFISYHNMMDERRNQNTFDTFPELKVLL